jgi:hypothetical protein
LKNRDVELAASPRYEWIMKAFLFLILTAGLAAHAQTRKFEFHGPDAEEIENIFYFAGRSSTVSNPLTGSTLHFFFHYRPERGGLSLDCSQMNPGFGGEMHCRLFVDSAEVVLNDPKTVRELARKLPQGEFRSRALGRDGRTPVLTIGCVDGAYCLVRTLTE